MINSKEDKQTSIMVKLGDVIRTQKGKKPKVLVSKPEPNYLPYIDIKAFEQNKFDNYTDGEKCLPCDEGDLLIVWDGARCGLTGLAHKGYVGSTLQKIWIPNVDNKYLLYFLRSKYTILNSKNQGSGTPHIKPEILMNFIIPLPPLAEQHRIVAKIEELFLELDRGIAGLEKAKAQLKTYRQAVLKGAFAGVLIEKESEWTDYHLSDIAEIVGGITKGRKLDSSEIIELPYLSVANVQNGFLDLRQMKNIQLKKSEREKYLLKENDVLYTEGGDKDKLGRGTIWKNEIPVCVHQNHIFRARLNEILAYPEFVAYYSQSQIARGYFFRKGKQSVNLASINMTVLRGLPISLPSLSEQKKIVSTIESRLSISDSLEKTINSSLKSAETLRLSILKKAFAGELVGQDPAETSSPFSSKENT